LVVVSRLNRYNKINLVFRFAPVTHTYRFWSSTAHSLPWLLLLIFSSVPLWAALGDNEQSVLADTARLNGSHRAVASANYSMHEIVTPTGHVVREFVSSGGTVFAVIWEGPTSPDLQLLLGTYFEQYQRSMAARPPSLNAPVNIDTPGLVFQQVGHMRAFRGRAYVPALVPDGTDTRAIR
jgi:hypothetical protein